MKDLIEKLKELAKLFPLENNFSWEIPENCPLKFPDDIDSQFERNLYLKHNFGPLLTKSDLANHYWVIQEWGGIRSLKQNAYNDARLTNLDGELEKGKLTKSIFSVISSLSKVASFIDHKKYAIYDSRVIYSLNWLLFKHTSETELYPQAQRYN